jgi:multiple sugar transport system substrate-binding protein
MSAKAKISRRAFLGTSAIVAGGAVVAACAPAAPAPQPSGGAAAPATEAPSAPTSAPAAPAGEVKTLDVVWRTNLQEQPLLQQEFAQFEADNPGVKINATFLPGAEFDQKVDLMVAAGTPPAIWAPLAARGVRYYAARDLCTILDDFIARDAYDTTAFYEGALDLCHWKGKWVGLPMLLVPIHLVYNKTLFDAEGVPAPTKNWDDKTWNWDAFLAAAQKLTKQDAAGKTIQFGYGGWPDQRYDIRDFGVNYFSKADQDAGYPTKFLGTTPDFIDALQFMGDVITKYKVAPSVAETQAMQGGAPDIFMTGKIAMARAGTWVFQTFATIKDFQWGTAAIPWPNKLDRWNWLYPDQYAIIKGQKWPDEAWALLKQLASAEGEKLHPIQSFGAVGPRKEVADYFVELSMKTSGLPKEEVQTAIDGMKYMSTAPGHATVEWQQYWEKAFAPSMDKVMLGTMTAADAVNEMEPIFNKIMEETTPKT